MSTFVAAWIMLILFSLFNNFVVWRMLSLRGRTDMMWIFVVATAVPVGAFALFPSTGTLLAFPIVQTIAMFLLLKRLQNSQKR
ncbi:MAG: hypothetical protein SFU83_21095 [Meiothermus sp.]|nr:hypothetical protein [Meiothermus sp.]